MIVNKMQKEFATKHVSNIETGLKTASYTENIKKMRDIL